MSILVVCIAMVTTDRQQAVEVTDLLPYVHRMAWLMFVNISLTLAAMAHKSATDVDADYMHQANILVSQCVSLVCTHMTTGGSATCICILLQYIATGGLAATCSVICI